MVKDLRELSLAEAKRLPLAMTIVDLGKLGEETVATFGVIAEEKRVQLSADTGNGLKAEADPNRIRQVLHNLLANAIHHTPSGGCVKLFAKRSEGQVKLVVHDSGAGIDTEKLAVIFNRFEGGSAEKRRDSDGSSGLGLAITKAIVELHNGSISAASPGKNKGSTFTIVLPA